MIIFERLKNNNGVNSILGVILTLISITVISAYVSITNTSWVTNEVQSIIDISATDALQDVINSDDLRKEIITVNNTHESMNTKDPKSLDQQNKAIDQNKVIEKAKDSYIAELNKSLRANGNLINSIHIESFDAGLENTMWGVNSTNMITGQQQARPQLFIDATVQVTLNENPNWDVDDNYKIKYFNAKSTDTTLSRDADKNISVLGTTKDGKVVLTVRTLTRLIYR